MSIESSSRRGFLVVLAQGGALCGAACLGVGCGAGGPIDAGNIKDLPAGTLRAVPGESAAIGRDAKGVYAMTLICPHAACDMENSGSVSAAEVTCSCHGSVFDPNGAVLQGPANSPLEHYAVTIDATGQITIHADQTVDASTRTAAG
jgi:nitrite reductase/ring-hydroxylating ferredoxin subunit